MKQKNIFKRMLSALILLMASSFSWAYDFKAENADGVTIYYDLINAGAEAEVTSNTGGWAASYSGEVIIPSTVTYNGKTLSVTSISGAFYGCSGLTSVTIPESVTNIGNSAFSNCSSLTSVNIPNSVTSIGEYAFRNCSGLTSVNIPNSVTSIGNYAFEGCSSLTSVNIPNSVTSISGAFSNCSSLTSIDIPNSVTSIDGGAFSSCTSLTSVTIPESVTSIGGSAFFSCTSLTFIDIPNSVTSIGNYAFSGCISLTSIDIPNSVTSIGQGAFNSCSSLTSIDIPNSVTNIGQAAFYGCNSLTSIVVDGNNPVYDSRNNCNAIIKTESNTLIQGCNNTIIPKSVTGITDSAFSGCSSLTSINIPNSVTYIGRSAFSGCSSLTSINIPNSVTYIYESAFEGCYSLTSVIIPNSVTNIGNGAFRDCSSLTSVNIPNSVTKISNNVFRDCSSLTSVDIPNSVTRIGERAFMNCSLTSVNIPNSVIGIEWEAFSGCESLTEVHISDLVAWCSIGFSYSANPLYYAHHLFLNGEEIKELVIPEGMTNIGNYVFCGCSDLTSVNIPNSVTIIGGSAFNACSGLTSVNIPEGVTYIYESAFRDCSGLTSVNIPNSVTVIGEYAFDGCDNLTSVISFVEKPHNLENNVFESIYSSAILYCPDPKVYKTTSGWRDFTDIRPLEGEEEATLAVGDAHYATFIAPFEVTIPGNVKAYTIEGVKEDGETLQMEELTETIPENTPVILYSKDVVDETLTGMRTTQGATHTHGLLTGVYMKGSRVPVGNYVLQNQDGRVAFYYVDKGSNQPLIGENRAYLTMPVAGENAVRAYRLEVGDEVTAVEQAKAIGQDKTDIYDLNGVRVDRPVKGIYLKNGKKVMVK